MVSGWGGGQGVQGVAEHEREKQAGGERDQSGRDARGMRGRNGAAPAGGWLGRRRGLAGAELAGASVVQRGAWPSSRRRS